MNIKIYYDNIRFRLRDSRKALNTIQKVIRSEKHFTGDLCFVFTSDNVILEINRKFLKHDYFTDVIAFGYNDGKIVNGEIYISIETVKRNANNYKVSLRSEAIRVMVHGTLHLLGYNDQSVKERERMRVLEDKWIREM